MPIHCPEGCGRCCGVVPIPLDVYVKNQDKLRGIGEIFITEEGVWNVLDDLMCPFLDEETKRCRIYEDRPEVCRIYGTSPELPCAYYDSSGRKRSRQSRRRMERLVNKQINKNLEAIGRAVGKQKLRQMDFAKIIKNEILQPP